jgi:hypothetical protein
MSKLIRMVLVAVLAFAGVAVAVPASAAPFCGIRWGSLPESAPGLSPAPITDVRTGRHACFDRIVFDTSFPAEGFAVSYVETVIEAGSGHILPVPGGAQLQITLNHPAYGALDADVRGFDTLRSIVFGGSFEGYTTFGIGTRARLPFRVFTLPARGDGGRMVLDVAHRW